jgi:hypothetical protein
VLIVESPNPSQFLPHKSALTAMIMSEGQLRGKEESALYVVRPIRAVRRG